jgi:hypothetical protein
MPTPFNLQFLLTGSGAHTDSYSIGTEFLSQGIKQPERGDHSLPTLTRLRMSGAITTLPLYACMAWTGETLPLFTKQFRITHSYSRTPLTRINWDSQPSRYAANLDNWIFL